jgi:hypothetical protein
MSGLVLPFLAGVSTFMLFCIAVRVVIFVPRAFEGSNVVLTIEMHFLHEPSNLTGAPAGAQQFVSQEYPRGFRQFEVWDRSPIRMTDALLPRGECPLQCHYGDCYIGGNYTARATILFNITAMILEG